MKLFSANPTRQRQACPQTGAKRQSAFTMVEIALSIAVVAFALVAIVGVLPTGLTVQRDNREDTIINQDGDYYLQAIRNGMTNIVELPLYVDAITISNQSRVLTWSNDFVNNRFQMTGRDIIGLLSTPKLLPIASGQQVRFMTNSVTARARAVSGSAVEKPLSASKDVAFSYLLISEVVPFLPAGVASLPTDPLYN